jgi:hypothetical protein
MIMQPELIGIFDRHYKNVAGAAIGKTTKMSGTTEEINSAIVVIVSSVTGYTCFGC